MLIIFDVNNQRNTQVAERILVVDDDSDIRRILGMLLERGGYEVIQASNGEEALDLTLNDNSLNLILLDLHMPGMSGFDICKKIKSDPTKSNLPIIFLTASGDSADKVNAFDMGAADYITKSFNKSELIARVKTQLKLSSTLKELESSNNKLAQKQDEFEEDLISAARIQESLLPRSITKIPGLETKWLFLPSHVVAGDLFNVVRLSEDYVGLYMLDVSGHGVSSAMVTVSVSQTLHGNNNSMLMNEKMPKKPGKLLSELNSLYPIERFGKYFTMVYLTLNIKSGSLLYSSAGHPSPILVKNDGNIHLLDIGGTITGFEEVAPFEEGEVKINPGDKLFLYTDGLTDHLPANINGEDRLKNILECNRNTKTEELFNILVKNMLENIPSDRLQDDVSCLTLDYNP